MPGFFDEFPSTGGMNYIGQEEKAVYVKNQTPLTIVKVFLGEGSFGPKYTAILEVDGTERAISFGAEKVESRDKMFENMIAYLERDEHEPIVVTIAKAGQAFILKPVE